jgi:hypothetical protein
LKGKCKSLSNKKKEKLESRFGGASCGLFEGAFAFNKKLPTRNPFWWSGCDCEGSVQQFMLVPQRQLFIFLPIFAGIAIFLLIYHPFI